MEGSERGGKGGFVEGGGLNKKSDTVRKKALFESRRDEHGGKT